MRDWIDIGDGGVVLKEVVLAVATLFEPLPNAPEGDHARWKMGLRSGIFTGDAVVYSRRSAADIRRELLGGTVDEQEASTA
jgi:hypothetical protein